MTNMTKMKESGFTKLVALMTILATGIMMLGLASVTKATQITASSCTISDSDKTVTADYQIKFTTPTGVGTSTDTIIVTFAAGINIDAVTLADVDLEDDTVDKTLAATAAAGVWGFATTSQVMTFTPPTDATSGEIIAASVVEILIGTSAGGGTNRIVNPDTAASYDIDISGGFGDSGASVILIVEDVDVSATVDAELTFTVTGTSTGKTIKDTTTDIETTATTIPFGNLSYVDLTAIGAQTIKVTTNATAGFTVNIFQNQNLTNDLSEDIDCFDDGTCATAPAVWSSPAGTIDTENTYGHFGITSEDNTLGVNCANDDFSTNKWAGLDGTTQDEVMCHTGPADGATEDKGLVNVGFRVELSQMQEPGVYTNVLTYIVTPTY